MGDEPILGTDIWTREQVQIVLMQICLAEDASLQEAKEAQEKAMVEGMENGRLSEKYAIARNLKEAGVSKSLIVQCIGLSEEKIERLQFFS